jgi:hypothetical protein
MLNYKQMTIATIAMTEARMPAKEKLFEAAP